jgi:hypothetical protein
LGVAVGTVWLAQSLYCCIADVTCEFAEQFDRTPPPPLLLLLLLLLLLRPQRLEHSRAVTSEDLRKQRIANAATVEAMAKQYAGQQR